jgi:hypothetical protein
MSVLRRDLPATGLDGFTSEAASEITPSARMNWSYGFGDRVETNLGRTAAVCVHPAAAWRLLPTRWRLLIVAAYAILAYSVTLGILLLRGLA